VFLDHQRFSMICAFFNHAHLPGLARGGPREILHFVQDDMTAVDDMTTVQDDCAGAGRGGKETMESGACASSLAPPDYPRASNA